MFLLLLYENSEITSLELKDKMRLGSESVLAGIVSGSIKAIEKTEIQTGAPVFGHNPLDW